MSIFGSSSLRGSVSLPPSINHLQSSRQSFACSTAVCLPQWKGQSQSSNSSCKKLEEEKRAGVRCAASSESKVGFFGKLGRVIKEKAKGDIDGLFNGFSKTRENLSMVDELRTYWNLPESENTLDELEEALLVADFCPRTALKIVDETRKDILVGKLTTGGQIKVLMAAGDTFLAAAREQLEVWANRTSSDIEIGEGERKRPAAVLAKATKRAVEEGYVVLFFRWDQYYSSEIFSRPRSCRYSPLGRIGSSAKDKIAPDQELVGSIEDADAESTNGSPSLSEEAPVCSKPDSDIEYLESFLSQVEDEKIQEDVQFPEAGLNSILETLVLISPFFLWGTAMVAMKGLLPKAGPMFVASVRLIPAGFLLVGYGAFSGKKQPTGLMAWLSIALFGLIDAACFQGFLVEGLKRTSAGLGSVIIDSQPLTVAILAAILFGESLGVVNYLGLALGIAGLLLLEVPLDSLQSFSSAAISSNWSSLVSGTTLNGLASWEGGEWRMLVAAQSMAVGTVMVRWVCQYSDPFMATGWHLVLGGIPLLALAVIQQDPALNGHIQDLSVSDWSALLYTSVGGSAISYGVFFYNATKGSLTKLSSLTFLTPMFAAIFGFLCLNETLTPLQLVGGVVTIGGVLLVNYKPSASIPVEDVNNEAS